MKIKLFICGILLMCTFLSRAGSFEWAKQVSHAMRGYDATSIKADKNNNLIIGGWGNFCLACPASYISKYDSLGNEIFYKSIISGSGLKSVGVDYNGNILLAPWLPSDDGQVGSDTFSYNSNGLWSAIIKLDPLGNLIWWKPWPGNFSIKMSVEFLW